MSDIWLFGYGSLIFRPGFPYEKKVVGEVSGYERRFWQASIDHRGTPDSPGRVVTLVETPGASCWGVAYRVGKGERDAVMEQLDFREKGGYSLLDLPFSPRGGTEPRKVLAYVGHGQNPQFRGPEDEAVTASIIAASQGPSGHNVEYVLRLAEALVDLDIVDPHVMRLANRLTDPDDVFGDDEAT